MHPILLTKTTFRKYLVFSTARDYRRFRRICHPNPGVTHMLESNTLNYLASIDPKKLLLRLRQRKLWEFLSDIPFSLARRAGVFPQHLHLTEKVFHSVLRHTKGSFKNSQYSVVNNENDLFVRRTAGFWLGRLPLILRTLRKEQGPSVVTSKLPPAAVHFYTQQYEPQDLGVLLDLQRKSLEKFTKEYTKKFAKNRLNYLKEPLLPLGAIKTAQDAAVYPLYNPIMPLRVTYRRSGNNIFSSVQTSFPRKTFLTLSGGSTGLKGRRKGTTTAAEQLGKALGDRFFANTSKVTECEKFLAVENNTNFSVDFAVEGENFDTIAKSFLGGILKSRRKFIPTEAPGKTTSLKKTVFERSFKVENILLNTRVPHNGTRKRAKRRV